jgi:hypothetical protein
MDETSGEFSAQQLTRKVPTRSDEFALIRVVRGQPNLLTLSTATDRLN